jgi:hypothetical protein
MRRKVDDDELLTAEQLADLTGVKLSYIRHARHKLGLRYYRLDVVKIRWGDWREFQAKRVCQAG